MPRDAQGERGRERERDAEFLFVFLPAFHTGRFSLFLSSFLLSLPPSRAPFLSISLPSINPVAYFSTPTARRLSKILRAAVLDAAALARKAPKDNNDKRRKRILPRLTTLRKNLVESTKLLFEYGQTDSLTDQTIF